MAKISSSEKLHDGITPTSSSDLINPNLWSEYQYCSPLSPTLYFPTTTGSIRLPQSLFDYTLLLIFKLYLLPGSDRDWIS
ncbi:hypothetical protein PanWU01x14_190650 [Parasponia andersonii]|uniref:Uncharacterized protein n=1 Tax=Parasponia andersonii TaxID=3476 RepID=A0A2P5C256_PARAD|nr:hypothetical protein PanWU01x14_190650 [Parasponia andersonii]